MKIQYVSEYIKLSNEGLVSKLECPMDQGPLFPNLKLSGDLKNDEIYLYCISCSYTRSVGIDFYNSIVEKVDNARK
jgi:hypothetical protein